LIIGKLKQFANTITSKELEQTGLFLKPLMQVNADSLSATGEVWKSDFPCLTVSSLAIKKGVLRHSSEK